MVFNAIDWPRLIVNLGIGTPAASVCVRGSGVRGTNVRGGRSMVNINAADDVNQVDIQRGRASEFDAATTGTATIAVDNTSGNYDPTNLFGPYVTAAPNLLVGDATGFEAGLGGWVNSSNSTPTQSAAQAHSGAGSMRLASVASGDMEAKHTSDATLATNGFAVTPGAPYSIGAWFRADATASPRSCQARVSWYDTNGINLLSTDTGSSITDSTSAWTQSTGTFTAPAGAAIARVRTRVQATGAANELHYADDVTFTPTVSLVDIGVPAEILVEWPAGTFWRRFTGQIADIAIDMTGPGSTVTFTCADGLENLGRAQLATEAFQFAGDLPGQRINNILDRAGWPAVARQIDLGSVALTPTAFGGAALELLRQVEQTEFGFLFCDETNTVIFYDRHRVTTANRSIVVQARFSTLPGPGIVSVVDVGIAAKSRERVINDARITRQPDGSQDPELTGSSPGDVPQEQIARDAASIGTATTGYGSLGLPSEVGTLAASDTAVLGLLQGIVGVYAQPQVRIREINVNALSAAQWATLLPLRLLDRVGVECDYGPSTFTAELLIQATGETIAKTPSPAWTMRFTTSNPPPATHYCVRGEGVRGTDIRGW